MAASPSPVNLFRGLQASSVRSPMAPRPGSGLQDPSLSGGCCAGSYGSSSAADASTTAEEKGDEESSVAPKSTLSSAAGAASKKDGKKVKDQSCRVCGLTFADMPRNGKECYAHQQDAAGLQKDLENKVKASPSDNKAKENLGWFKDQRKSAGPPPSEYSKEVLTYSQNCPSRGAGKARAGYNQFRQMEETVAGQEANVGVRAIKMHKERFMTWATRDACLPTEYADGWWKTMFREYDHEDKKQVDQLGPTFSKLQLAVPTENFSEGSLSEQHNKRLQLLSKAKKIGSEEELDKAQTAMQSGHATFNDKTLSHSGGALLTQIGKMGATTVISSSGATEFSQPSASKPASENKFGADAVIEKEKEKPKKVKKFCVPTNQAKLQEAIIDPSSGQYGILKKATSDTMSMAAATLKVAHDLKQTMPGVEKWSLILQDRIRWLEQSVYGVGKRSSDIKLKPEWDMDKDLEYSMFTKTINAVNRARTHVPTGAPNALPNFDHLKPIEELLALEGFADSWAKIVLASNGFADGSFGNPVDLDLNRLEEELDEMAVVRVAVIAFDQFQSSQKCAPVMAPAKLMPLCSLRFMALSTRNCEDEHDLKELGLYFEGARDTLKELIKSVSESVRQVEAYVESQRTAEINKVEKEKETEAKERIRVEKATVKKAEQEARKEQKHLAAGIEKGNMDEHKPSELFNIDGDNVKPLTCYDSSAEFTKAHAARNTIPVEPYCIAKVPELETLFEDKDVEGQTAIFSMQFSCAIKKDGKGQVPMTSTRNTAIRETILNMGPNTLDLKMAGAGLPKNVQAVKNFMQSVSHFGYVAKCNINGEHERFGMASFRYQTRGKRQIVLVRIDDIINFFPLSRLCDKPGKDMFTILAPTHSNRRPEYRF